MSTEKDAAFYERWDKAWQAAWNEGNLDALDEFVAPDFVRHSPPGPDVVGLEGFKKFIADVRISYPDWHLTYDGGIGQGDFSAGHGMCQGTMTGKSPSTGFQGTGQKVNYAWSSYDRWVGDKLAEEWAVCDFVTMMRQQGYTFTPPEPKK